MVEQCAGTSQKSKDCVLIINRDVNPKPAVKGLQGAGVEGIFRDVHLAGAKRSRSGQEIQPGPYLTVCALNCAHSRMCARSSFATTISPLVPLSNRWTMPGRSMPGGGAPTGCHCCCDCCCCNYCWVVLLLAARFPAADGCAGTSDAASSTSSSSSFSAAGLHIPRAVLTASSSGQQIGKLRQQGADRLQSTMQYASGCPAIHPISAARTPAEACLNPAAACQPRRSPRSSSASPSRSLPSSTAKAAAFSEAAPCLVLKPIPANRSGQIKSLPHLPHPTAVSSRSLQPSLHSQHSQVPNHLLTILAVQCPGRLAGCLPKAPGSPLSGAPPLSCLLQCSAVTLIQDSYSSTGAANPWKFHHLAPRSVRVEQQHAAPWYQCGRKLIDW